VSVAAVLSFWREFDEGRIFSSSVGSRRVSTWEEGLPDDPASSTDFNFYRNAFRMDPNAMIEYRKIFAFMMAFV
jgi:hypothetical protein